MENEQNRARKKVRKRGANDGEGVRMGLRDARAFYSKTLFFRRESDEMESEKEDFSTPEFPTPHSAISMPNAECPVPSPQCLAPT